MFGKNYAEATKSEDEVKNQVVNTEVDEVESKEDEKPMEKKSIKKAALIGIAALLALAGGALVAKKKHDENEDFYEDFDDDEDFNPVDNDQAADDSAE